MWLLPLLIVGLTVLLSVPLSRWMARVFDRDSTSCLERIFDTGPQSWKQYCCAMLLFNAVAFIIGYAILALQPWLPLNPDNKGMLSPTTIFNTACSFLTNTNLQHYSGEIHLSYFSQLFFVCWKQFVTPAIGLAALLAIIRGLRGDKTLGNFYLDIWRGVVCLFLPLAVVLGFLLMLGGVPMTLEGNASAVTVEGNPQTIARGPVAAIVAIKQLGTNGGGFFGANSSHPFENPNAFTNIVECVSIILVSFAALLMFGRMLRQPRHARLIYGVSALLLAALIAWGITAD